MLAFYWMVARGAIAHLATGCVTPPFRCVSMFSCRLSWPQVGPTVILHASKDDAAMKEEIFGPVLSVYVVSSWEEAIAIENSNPYGNAASIYTSSGGNAEWFTSRFRAGMIGVNIGIPVPREPFSFGGLYPSPSKFGDMDITGDGCLELFTRRRKVTTKWSKPSGFGAPTGASGGAAVTDKASFVGKM